MTYPTSSYSLPFRSRLLPLSYNLLRLLSALSRRQQVGFSQKARITGTTVEYGRCRRTYGSSATLVISDPWVGLPRPSASTTNDASAKQSSLPLALYLAYLHLAVILQLQQQPSASATSPYGAGGAGE